MHSLRTQITLTLALLSALFAIAILYAMHIVDQQRRDDLLLRLGGEIQILQQHMGMQAMNYQENAPRDYPTYFRDVRLYYQDLLHVRERVGQILEAFASGRITPTLHASQQAITHFELPPRTAGLARALHQRWQAFDQELETKLGDPKEPRLEWAAEWILAQHQDLTEQAGRFLEALEQDLERRAERALLFGKLMLITGIALVIGILTWFYLRVLRPLRVAVRGFHTVATGDFAYRVPVPGNNEIGWLVTAFNQLTERLESLLQLLTRLQRANELDDALRILSETLPHLVPLDWVGLLVLAPDGRMQLQQAYSDGRRDTLGILDFTLQGTLLQECLHSGTPLHIANVGDTARMDRHYRFLEVLRAHGGHEAVFMPILGNEPRVGVLVMASRHPNTYTSEHLSLLNNLSALFGTTFARTLVLTENARLAAIGQFTSGIVHEIRTPLATIGMALEHLAGLGELNAGGRRRACLALNESRRLGRLLENILLYAKPLTLQRQPLRLEEVVDGLATQAPFDTPRLHIDRASLEALPPVPTDRDRITQVLLNLLQNALEANGEDERGVHLRGELATDGHAVVLIVENGGPTIREEQMAHLFEPFYTTRVSGTGLGLPIVHRIVQAHGGSIRIISNDEEGTRVEVTLPLEPDIGED